MILKETGYEMWYVFSFIFCCDCNWPFSCRCSTQDVDTIRKYLRDKADFNVTFYFLIGVLNCLFL